MDSLSFFVGSMIAVMVIGVSGLFSAGKTCNDHTGAVQSHPACSARNKILPAVFAHPALQVRGDAHTMPHPNPSCYMDVTVAQERARF